MATSDRNFYDRYYFNAFDTGGQFMAVFGLGQYPNLGTTDAFIIAAFAPFSIAAKIAFLVAGPLIDLKLYWLYRSAFKPSFVHALWLRALAATFLLTLLYSLRP